MGEWQLRLRKHFLEKQGFYKLKRTTITLSCGHFERSLRAWLPWERNEAERPAHGFLIIRECLQGASDVTQDSLVIMKVLESMHSPAHFEDELTETKESTYIAKVHEANSWPSWDLSPDLPDSEGPWIAGSLMRHLNCIHRRVMASPTCRHF